ncbi:TPA: EAL domain-containing protein [Pseudomonas aeruginosa]
MPIPVKRARRKALRLSLSVLVGVMPIVLGLLILYWQAERSLQETSEQAAGNAVRQFERMLDNAALAARKVMPVAGRSCPEAELALREQVATMPFVRSVNLTRDNTIYCTSLFGGFDEPVRIENYVDGRLWLMPGNQVTPDAALLVLRDSDGKRGVLAAIDGRYLSYVLDLVDRRSRQVLVVGPNWLDAEGRTHRDAPPTYEVAAVSLASQRYPLRVLSGFPEGEEWRSIRSQNPAMFGLLLFFGLLAGTLCYWLSRRVASPSSELRRALEANEFIPYYQPLSPGQGGRWIGVEVLMRWRHPREGLIRPDLFIPFAERSGLIVPMTRALMRQVAEDLGGHAGKLEPGFHIGFNISATHCHELALVDDCRELLAAFPPGHITLVLELTERELIESSEVTDRLFDELYALGVKIAIDDFGTGHSSLAYLRKFQVDCLKIDQSFVARIGIDTLSGHILDSIVELSAKLDLDIVAEGVETPEQRDYLAARGVDYLQGYLIGRPMPLESLLSSLTVQEGQDASVVALPADRG